MAEVELTTFVHPHKAYRLQYPAHWESIEKDDGASCGFGPRDRDDVGLWITILPASIDSERIEKDLAKLFEQAIKNEGVNVRRDATLRHYGLQADNVEDKAGQFWMIVGGDLVIFASSQVPAAERAIWEPQFQRLMTSLEITRDREFLLRKTADQVFKRLRELHPEQDYRLEQSHIQGREHRISLANVFKQVEAAPNRREEIVERFVEGLSSMVEHPPGSEKLDDVRDQILPVLKPAAYISAHSATEHLVRRPWVGDVIICYAIRSDRLFRLLTGWDLNRWGIDQNDLHKLATGNLVRLPWPDRMEGAAQSGGRLIMVNTGDSLDVSRALHPDLHHLLSRPLGSPFYVGIPSSDTLVAFSAGDSSLFEHVLRQLHRDYETSAHPISPEPFLVTSRGITVAKM